MLKRILIIFVGILLLSFWFFNIFLSHICRFGYLVHGDSYVYPHNGKSFIVPLDNGNLLFLGENMHESLKEESCSISSTPKFLPSEVYNIKTGKFEKFDMPSDFLYLPMGIMLKDNKLFLPFAAPLNNVDMYKDGSVCWVQYNYFAVVDLDTKRLIQMKHKKIDEKYDMAPEYTTSVLLNNGNVLVLDFYNNKFELYNPKLNAYKLLYIKLEANKFYSYATSLGDKVLLLGGGNADYNKVLELDPTRENLKPVGKVRLRYDQTIKMLSNGNFVLFGGVSDNSTDVREVELYDVLTNKSKVITRLKKQHSLNFGLNFLSGDLIDDSLLLVSGGNRLYYPFYYESTDSEIVNVETGKVYSGPKLYMHDAFHSIIRLKNGNLLIVPIYRRTDSKKSDRQVEVFKLRKGNR